MILPAGTRLGPYEIVSQLGAGGMGEVYRARDSKLGRSVAIKVLPSQVAKNSEMLDRFRREARVLASLNHPNIASIYGFEDSDKPGLVMELVEGPTLADCLSAGPMPVDEAMPIARQICEALEYAHERGIIHRDVKPANIKVTADGTVKLLDFGLAKALEEPGRKLRHPEFTDNHESGDASRGDTGHGGLHASRAGKGGLWIVAPTSGVLAASSSRCSPEGWRSGARA